MKYFRLAFLSGLVVILAGCDYQSTTVTVDSKEITVDKRDNLGQLESVQQIPLNAPLSSKTTTATYNAAGNSTNQPTYSYDAQGNHITNQPTKQKNQ